MANVKSIFQLPTRPCWVDGRRAIFHRWTDSARPVKARGMEESEETPRYQLHSVHALVEYEDGTMERVWPNAVRFADSDELFAGYDWEGMEHRRDELPYTYDIPNPTYDDPSPTPPDNKENAEPPKPWHVCDSCAHVEDNKDFCAANDYKCQECTVIGCYCKTCRDYKKWEPKGGTA